jgi:phage shock protein A
MADDPTPLEQTVAALQATVQDLYDRLSRLEETLTDLDNRVRTLEVGTPGAK